MTTSNMKVYGMSKTANTNKAAIAAKYAGVNIDIQDVDFGKTNKTPEFLSKFPFGKVPAMETPEGPLYESNAIAYYVASKKPELVGKNAYEQALIQQYICSFDCELFPVAAKVVYPALGYAPYVAAEWKVAVDELIAKLKIYDTILTPRTYLVGETITLADIILTCSLERVYTLILESSDRKNLVNLTRYFVTMINQANVKAVIGELSLCDKRVDPAKAKPIAAPKAAAVAAPAAHNEEEEEPAPKPKEKNPMDLLPPAKLNLEDWKRFYSNCKETRPVATNWFWEHYEAEAYSIWRADYKYNEELKKIFMTCNLVTGLFARMDAMRKYCFASVLIFGEDDKNEISGFFVIRGTDMPELMKDVPDFECYNWTKIDTTDAKQRELFNDYLAWDGELEGKTLNQGKIFK